MKRKKYAKEKKERKIKNMYGINLKNNSMKEDKKGKKS